MEIARVAPFSGIADGLPRVEDDVVSVAVEGDLRVAETFCWAFVGIAGAAPGVFIGGGEADGVEADAAVGREGGLALKGVCGCWRRGKLTDL